MSVTPYNGFPSEGSEALRQFQTTTDTASKKDPAFGASIARAIVSTISGSSGYYALRNERYRVNDDWASGRTDVQAKFQDLLGLNGEINYININWKSIMMVNTIVGKLVNRWMGNNEKIEVAATDSLSVQDKQDGYAQAEFYMQNKQKLAALQQQTGVQMIPQDQFIPDDKDELDLWMAHYQRIPEEILFEMGTNSVLDSEGFFDEMKRYLLWQGAVKGFKGTRTWMDEDGVIHVRACKPDNCFYSNSDFDDFRDTAWRGEIIYMKVSEVRARYGDKLNEEEIWKIAQMATEFKNYSNLVWNTNWVGQPFRPYDDWNIEVIDFELKSLDTETYTLVETKKNKSLIVENGKLPKGEYVANQKWNIYRGVYIRSMEKMLEWGLKTNMIRPKDPKEIGNVEFSYSFFMYQNRDMRNIAIPEKIEEPVEGIVLARLKIQQLIAKMKPNGSAVNVRALQEVQLGLADGTKPLDLKKIYDQTGDLYYTDIDAEGNQIPGVPISAAPDDGFYNKLQALVQTENFHQAALRSELGEDPDINNALSRPRVTTDNAKAALAETENATSHIYDGYLNVMEQTAKKVSCLLYDSVIFGAEAYRKLFQEDDIRGRIFQTSAKMLPPDVEIQGLELMMNNAMAANPDFIMYCDPFKVTRMAKEDIKMAELYFRNCQKKMIKGRADQAAQNAQVNGQEQQQSLQMKAQMDAQAQSQQLQAQMQMAQATSDGVTRNTFLTSIMKMFETGMMIPAQLQPLVQSVLETVALPAMVENQDMRMLIAQQMQQQQQAAQQQQQLPPSDDQGQPQQNPNQPPPNSPQQLNAA